MSEARAGKANFHQAVLSLAVLTTAKLSECDITWARLNLANLAGADLRKAQLDHSDLFRTNLSGADLSGADLRYASLIETIFNGANLNNCSVYGVSAWGLQLDRTSQTNLTITPPHGPVITADNLEVAQFLYIMLNNEKLRSVIDTITSKVI